MKINTQARKIKNKENSAMKQLKIFLIFSFIFILSGCWGKSELQDIAVVSGIGIDKDESNQIIVTTQTIKPEKIKENDPQPYLVRESSGETVFEAVRDFIITAGKQQLWQHIEIFVIGMPTAENGVTEIIDFLYRDHEPRSSMNLFISDKTASEIININSEVGVIPAIAMKESLEHQASLGKAPQVMFHEFLEAYEDPFIDAFLPIIQKNKETGDFQIYGTAIFKGNKVVGELSSYETKAMLRVLNQIKGGIEVITLDSISEDENNSKITVEIKSSKSNLEARFENGIPIIEINIKETGTISGLSKPIDLTNKKIMEIKKEYEKVIKSETSKVVGKVTKDFNSDIFAFSHTINRANKVYWKKHQNQWDELLPTLEVKVNVAVEIEHYGLIRKINEN